MNVVNSWQVKFGNLNGNPMLLSWTVVAIIREIKVTIVKDWNAIKTNIMGYQIRYYDNQKPVLSQVKQYN